MPIDGGIRKSLVAGTRLVATYRKQEHIAEVVTGEDGKLRFRLADGREFGSPSAAGSAASPCQRPLSCSESAGALPTSSWRGAKYLPSVSGARSGFPVTR